MKESFEEQRRHVSFGCFFLGFIIILLVLTQSCSNTIPAIDVTFWSGDSAKNGISRSQDKKTIECSDPQFDEYVCLTYEDVQKIYETLLKCKQWGVETMSPEETLLLIKKNKKVIDHVIHRKKQMEPI